ncbi:MAG: ACP S-malonyltransferase [bacterium]
MTTHRSTAFLFPGQGSQKVGMWAELKGVCPNPDPRLVEAEEILGLSLGALMDEGPDEQLRRTENAQPCLLLANVVYATALEERGERADIVLGHSLGEYAALVLSGALEFTDALRLVRARGVLMARASAEIPGKMAAILAMDRDTLETLLSEHRHLGVLEVTNLNAPKQLVLSGETAAVDSAVSAINTSRLGRAVPLNVSAPFHSSLMKPVAGPFAEQLAAVEIRPPERLFIDNVTGEPEADPDRIRTKLVQQIHRPVLWESSVRCAVSHGAARLIECGPGNVLTGLTKRIAPSLERPRCLELLSRSDPAATA